ncbi:MAG TPA: hypothetical protein VGW74_21055 [Propionibacteriaceae bacterium]|nr:hypothetical protein [Propionibacteriaceae bacterium]
MTADALLRHGYSLADAHQLARLAVHTDRSHSNRDYVERLDVAFGGIVEHLYAAEMPPHRSELVERGRSALRDDKQGEMRFRGVSHHTMAPMPHFWRYWWFLTGPVPSPEGRIVDRLSLWQVWPTLRPDEQEALLALAVHEDYQRAADALGLRYNTFAKRVRSGRLRFLRELLGGETPRTWGHDRRAGRRGERAASQRTAAQKLHRRHQMRGTAMEAVAADA